MSNLKKILVFLLIIIAIYLFIANWFFPFRITEFTSQPRNSNFNLNSSNLVEMQFYENMRFPYPNISYKIEECILAKQDEMKRAFDLLENSTILSFYPVYENEELTITCDSHSKLKEGMFIGGEGGPTNITRTDKFSVITKGSILLLKETQCKNPNIALHELLHTTGFNHSSNRNNIMFPVVKCDQTIGEDIITLINELYSYPTYPDLSFENVSTAMEGRFLDLNMTIRNHGLIKSGVGNVKIYADDQEIKTLPLSEIEIGAGRMLVLSNVFITKINFDKFELIIEYDGEELDKQNNIFTLKIKK